MISNGYERNSVPALHLAQDLKASKGINLHFFRQPTEEQKTSKEGRACLLISQNWFQTSFPTSIET